MARVRRLISCSISQPPTKPSRAPTPNCWMMWTTKDQLNPLWPVAIISIRVTVRNTAIGSLLPDSISRVALTRSLRPRPPSRLNTAAASVEPTIAPISRPSRVLRPNSQVAATPVNPAVTSTPMVARDSEGQSATRKVAARVRMPPSRRMMASARLPTR
ncbi:hypothetical protein FQZ97_900330 [compost metagenome]